MQNVSLEDILCTCAQDDDHTAPAEMELPAMNRDVPWLPKQVVLLMMEWAGDFRSELITTWIQPDSLGDASKYPPHSAQASQCSLSQDKWTDRLPARFFSLLAVCWTGPEAEPQGAPPPGVHTLV